MSRATLSDEVVGVETHRAQHFSRGRVDGDECDGAGIIELGQPRNELVAELAHRGEETQPHVFRRYLGEEAAHHGIVVRAHRSHERLAAVAEPHRALPFLRIGANREARMARPAPFARERRDRNPRVDGDDAGVVREQRVDVELANFGHERNFVLARGRDVAIGPQQPRDAGARD